MGEQNELSINTWLKEILLISRIHLYVLNETKMMIIKKKNVFFYLFLQLDASA